MSRIGIKPINVPSNVTVEVKDGGRFGYKQVSVTGPKGTLSEDLRRGVSLEQKEGVIDVVRLNDSNQNRAFHGLYRSIINNMVEGVVNGYTKSLELVGIGYRAEMQGTNLVLSVGFSHKINFTPPVGIEISVEEQTKIKISGSDKQKVGEVAAKIRSFREPEPYKGKGIKYSDEIVKRKSAKAAVAG